MFKYAVAFMSIVMVTGAMADGLISQAEGQRRKAALAQIDADLSKAVTEDQKLTIIRQATKDEASPDMRREILARAELLTSPGQEDWLIERLRDEPDCLLRGAIASLLGKKGTQKAIDPIITTAKSDSKTSGEMGCMIMEGTARRQAMFALAELGNRLPAQRQRIVEALRAIPDSNDKADTESLHDVRLQSLYQLTAESDLIKEFFQRLSSNDPKQRVRGVVAFRFLRLSRAPTELVARLEDSNEEVRSWAALVLGEIGDPATVSALMATAENTKLDRATRANAIVALRNMKAKAATELMNRLSKDKDDTIAHLAAAAIYALRAAETRPATTSNPTK